MNEARSMATEDYANRLKLKPKLRPRPSQMLQNIMKKYNTSNISKPKKIVDINDFTDY
jgi:hypothetical protein